MAHPRLARRRGPGRRPQPARKSELPGRRATPVDDSDEDTGKRSARLPERSRFTVNHAGEGAVGRGRSWREEAGASPDRDPFKDHHLQIRIQPPPAPGASPDRDPFKDHRGARSLLDFVPIECSERTHARTRGPGSWAVLRRLAPRSSMNGSQSGLEPASSQITIDRVRQTPRQRPRTPLRTLIRARAHARLRATIPCLAVDRDPVQQAPKAHVAARRRDLPRRRVTTLRWSLNRRALALQYAGDGTSLPQLCDGL